jgi:hypothetical protein
MGGNVAWTLRLADRTEHRMDRWTNIFSGVDGVTTDDAFLRGEPKAIEDALQSWLAMKSDWEKNQDTGEFEHNMTSVYAPYPYGLKPSEYGFFVTDFINHTIVSCQHYTTLMRFHVYPSYNEPENLIPPNAEYREGVVTLLNTGARLPKTDTDVYGRPLVEQYKILRSLYEAGRITGFDQWDGQSQSAEGLSLEEIIDRATAEPEDSSISSWQEPIKGKHRRSLSYVHVKPLEPWKILEFNKDSKSGRAAAFSAVQALGFELSDEETKDFEDWIAERGQWGYGDDD